MNEPYRKLLGYSDADGMVLKLYQLDSLIHTEDFERAQGCMTKAAETGFPTLGEYRLQRKDGNYINIESQAAALRQRGKAIEPPQLIALIRELGAVAPLSPLNSVSLNALLASLSVLFRDAILLYDWSKSKPLYFSYRFADLLGYTTEEMQALVNNKFADVIIHPGDRGVTPTGQIPLESLPDGAVQERMLRLKHKDGEWRTFFARLAVQTRDSDGKPHILTCVCISTFTIASSR